jgi:hypothetical protein
MNHLALLLSAVLLAFTRLAYADTAEDVFMVRATSKTPDAVVAAIETYSAEKKWQYLGASRVKQGQVRLVKLCIPEVGKLIWPIGMQLSALLPCGNVGIYQNGATTEISILHPRYMYVLYPHPATERASTVAQPLLSDMLDAVTKNP